jgi:threonine synthase
MAHPMRRNHLTAERPTFVAHLECGLAGDRYEADRVHGLSKAGRPLLVRYDLPALARSITQDELATRPADLWRYREFLPVRRAENIVSLGEVQTPLLELPRLRQGSGILWTKDEGRLPTGSFKARGLCLAVSMAKELGIKKVAMPTNGNAGAALAAYATRARIQSYVFCPADTPEINLREIAAQGAKVWRVNGLINDCGKIVGQGQVRLFHPQGALSNRRKKNDGSGAGGPARLEPPGCHLVSYRGRNRAHRHVEGF